MLKPTKYTDVNISLIAISSEILKHFRSTDAIPYQDLLNKIIGKKGIEAKNVFLPALSFLFLLGKVEYHNKSDLIRFQNENK